MSRSLESLIPTADAEIARPSLGWQLVAFVIVGGSAAVAFIALSTLMISLRTGLPDWLVSAACYAVMILPAYLAHHAFSFKSEAPHRQALPRYVAVQLTAIALAAVFSFVCYGVLRLPTIPSAVLVAGLTAAVNFVVVRSWAFAVRG